METVLSAIPPTLLTLVAVLFAGRMALRHIARSARERRIGRLVWFELRSESRRVDSTAPIEKQVQAVQGFSTTLRARWPYFNRGVASIILSKGDDGQLRLFVGLDQSHIDHYASQIKALADGLSCRPIHVDSPPMPRSSQLVVAHRNRFTPASIDKQPSTLGGVASKLSGIGDFRGAVVVTLDHMRSSETKRLESNVTEESIMREGASSSFSNIAGLARIMGSSAVRASIGAISADGDMENSRALLNNAVSSVETLGLTINDVDPSRHHARQVAWVSAAYTALMAGWGYLGMMLIPATVALCALGAVGLVLGISGAPLLSRSWFTARLAKGEIAVPPFFWWSIRYKLHGVIRGNYRFDAGGDEPVANQIAPPSCKQVIPLYRSSLSEFISVPQTQVTDMAQEGVPMIGLPSNLVLSEGVFLGVSGADQPVNFPHDRLQFGMYTSGGPGSGKTNLLMLAYAGVADETRKDTTGMRITPIWGETKGGAAVYEVWGMVRQRYSYGGNEPLFVDLHNPRSPQGIALEGRRLSEGASPQEVAGNCEVLVSALQFAYGDGIKAASREILLHSLRVALLLSPEELRYLELDDRVDPVHPNAVELAHIILGGDPQVQPGQKLIGLIQPGHDLPMRDSLLRESINNLSPYISQQGRKDKGPHDRVLPAMNKLSDLRGATTVWDPPKERKNLHVGAIVNRFAPVVINMGPYYIPDTEDYASGMSNELNERLARILNYLIWNYIKSQCVGWGRAGKRVMLFFDEIKCVAVDSTDSDAENVYAQVNADGREFGTSYWAASQNPDQLPFQARNEAMGLRNKVWFAHHAAEGLEMVARQLGAGDERRSSFTMENIKSLPDGVSIATVDTGPDLTPPFTLRVPHATVFSQYLERSATVHEAMRSYVDDGHTFGTPVRNVTARRRKVDDGDWRSRDASSGFLLS